jgi:hypothetical protein
MLEKISHVRNPLTVIAIFAGLAEVSGTVVLPFLEHDTQRTYVWFLMIFPCLLVLLFFITLFLKHYVLYAPSDFRDDKLFADLFVTGSGAQRVNKLHEEAALEAAAEVPEPAELPEIPLQLPPVAASANQISAKEVLNRDVRATALLAEELVLAKLSQELGVKFERNVSPKGQPSLLFDAIAMTPGRTLAVEVKFTRHGMYPRELLTRTFDRIHSFVSTLPEDIKRNFEFVFAVATQIDRPERAERIRSMLTNVASDYPFKTSIKIYDYNELEREFPLT